MFDLRADRQHQVGVVDRVGGELLVNDSEQVAATESFDHAALAGCDGSGVGVVDEQQGDGWPVELPGQGLGQLVHVDRPCAGRNQIGSGEPIEREGVIAAGREQDAAGAVSPGTDHRGQAADGADGHSTSGVPLHPVIDSDRGRWSGAVFPGELFDVVGGDPGDVRRSLRRPVTGHPFFESLGSHAVPFHVVTVDQAVAEQDVHHSQRQGRIGSDPRSDMPITPFGGAAPVGVDCHDAGSLLSGLVHPHRGACW